MKHSTNQPPSTVHSHSLWDAFCIATVIGIWPRFIEPQLIDIKKLNLPIPHLPKSLKGFKILQFSDLHLNFHVSDSFLKRLVYKIRELKPDIVVFTGDFLCYSDFCESKRLQTFLNKITAPYGCFAILGNHDYANYVSINQDGDYDIIDHSRSSIIAGFKRLFTTTTLTKKTTERAKKVDLHRPLLKLLKNTPFTLLHNASIAVQVKDAILNICGLGEYTLGQFKPEEAFQNYKPKAPGILLLHNPDGAYHLKQYPGDLVLCGHTHGGQVNLPWMWKKFTLMENKTLKKGLFKIDKKDVYINRGVGSVMPFRWFSRPELLLITLE